MRTHRSLLLGVLPFASAAAGAVPPSPEQPKVDPITAGVASGVAVEVLKGLAGLAAGDKRAQVRSGVKHTGPDGDDKKADSNADVNDLWFEYDLDSDTGTVSAPNAGDPHLGWARLHYHWKDGGWGPNLDDYADADDSNGFTWNWAWAKPDTTPVAGSENKTESAAVSAFFLDGEKSEVWHKSETGVLPGPRGRAAAETITSQAAARMYFTPEMFAITDAAGGRKRVALRDGATTIDMLHSTVALGADGRPLLSPNFMGVGDLGDEVIAEQFAAGAADSLNPVLWGTGSRAELTIAGLSLALSEGTYNAIDPNTGLPKTAMQLIREFLMDPAATSTLAPESAQNGYTPTITSRQVVEGMQSIDPSGLPADAQSLVGRAHFAGIDPDGNLIAAPTNLIGIVLGVSGSLIDSLNLAANTPGSAFAQFVSGLPVGTEFTLDLSYSSASTALAYSSATAYIPSPGALGLAGLGAGLLVARRRR